MYRQSGKPVIMRHLVASLLASMGSRPSAAIPGVMSVDLFTAGPSVITPDNVVADFTLATFGGYAQQGLDPTTPPPVEVPANNGLALIGNGVFYADITIVPPGQIVIGYILTDQATGLILEVAELFDDPVSFAVNGDFLNLTILVPILTLPQIG